MPASVLKSTRAPRASDFVSLEAARGLISTDGRRAPRERLLSLGLEGEMKVRRFGDRWWVSRRSIEEYLARCNSESQQ